MKFAFKMMNFCIKNDEIRKEVPDPWERKAIEDGTWAAV